MAERWGEKERWGGLDNVWGAGEQPPHPHSGAVMMHTVATVRTLAGVDRIWTGPGSLILQGGYEELRNGDVDWHYDEERSVALAPLLPGFPADGQISACCNAAIGLNQRVFVSHTERKFWYNTGGSLLYQAFDFATLQKPAWVPTGHQIYPLGGCAMLGEGTLVIACGACPPREVSSTSASGFRYPMESGRWFLFLIRLRNPSSAYPRAGGTPQNVGNWLMHTPFPLGDGERQRFDLRTFWAGEGRQFADGTFSPSHLVFMFTTDWEQANAGLSGSGTYMGVTGGSWLDPPASFDDDQIPLWGAHTKIVNRAPLWSQRGDFYRVNSHFASPTHSWWTTTGGNLSAISTIQSLQVSESTPDLLLDLYGDSGVGLSSALRHIGTLAYAGVLIGDSPTGPEIIAVPRQAPIGGELMLESYRPYVRYDHVEGTLGPVSPLTERIGVDDSQRVRATLYLPGETDAGGVFNERSPPNVDIDVVWSPDGGLNWRRMGRSLRGEVSSPSLTPNAQGGFVYECEIATLDSDSDRSAPAYWVNAAQQAGANGDKFFEGSPDARRRLELWPPR